MKSLIAALPLLLVFASQADALLLDKKFPPTKPVMEEFPVMPQTLFQLLENGWSITNVLSDNFVLLMGPEGRRPAFCNYSIDPKNSTVHMHVVSQCFRKK